jgi:hypothetical protein
MSTCLSDYDLLVLLTHAVAGRRHETQPGKNHRYLSLMGLLIPDRVTLYMTGGWA